MIVDVVFEKIYTGKCVYRKWVYIDCTLHEERCYGIGDKKSLYIQIQAPFLMDFRNSSYNRYSLYLLPLQKG